MGIYISFSGRAGQDAEIKTYGEGKQLVSFSVATDTRTKNSHGVYEKETCWVQCTTFANVNYAKLIKKGCTVYVTGELSVYNVKEKTIIACTVHAIEITLQKGKVDNSVSTATDDDPTPPF